MTRNQKILDFVANGGTYDEAAAMFNVTRNVVGGICYRAGLKVGQRYNDRQREIGRRSLDSPRDRAKWIAALKAGLQRARCSGA